LASHIEGGTEAESIREYSTEEDVWTQEGQGNRGVEKAA